MMTIILIFILFQAAIILYQFSDRWHNNVHPNHRNVNLYKVLALICLIASIVLFVLYLVH